MKVYISILFSVLFSVLAFADDTPTMDEAEWERLTKDVDYVEQEREESSFKLPSFGWDVDSNIVKYIFFLIIVATLIYVLVKYIIAMQSAGVIDSSSGGIEVEDLEEAEANPMKADLNKLIQKLINSGEYREAIRAYFLLVLQRMHRSSLIEWKKPKTNFDYVREVKEQSFHSDFKQLTKTFEHVWYGKHSVNENGFQVKQQEFQQLLAKLPNE